MHFMLDRPSMMENQNLSMEASVEEIEPPKLANGSEESVEPSATPPNDEGW